jgi:hypothetical protein
MAEALAEFQELGLVNSLISGLENLITESDSVPLVISSPDQAKRAAYVILNATTLDRKPKPAEAMALNESRLILHCNKTDLVKQANLEVTIQAGKNGRGENTAVVTGRVLGLKRVRGGYDIEIGVGELRMSRITPGQKLRECLGRKDTAAWNRWCQDILDEIDLTGMDLRQQDLSGYDLCCADLSGSDLTGANLAGTILAGANLRQCKLENVTVTTTDFFHAVMHRGQVQLLAQSGMPEIESVVF